MTKKPMSFRVKGIEIIDGLTWIFNIYKPLLFFRLRSSQNVALLQYRIPRAGEGFVFRVTMELTRDRKF